MRDRPPGISEVDADSVARGYESRDLRIRPLLFTFVGFLALSALICGGLWWFYSSEMSPRPALEAGRSAVSPSTTPVDAPPLQPQIGHESLDAWDLRAMREKENAAFAAMGWRPDERTKRYAVPADVVDAVQRRYPASRPTEGGR